MTALEDLALSYQQGSHEALDEIITRCSYIVKSVSRKYFLMGAETEDLFQEGYLGLIKAAKCYEKGKSSFKGFAFICVNTAIITAVRRYAGDKNKVLNDGLPLSEAADNPSFYENPEEIFIEDETHKEFLKNIEAKLSAFEKKVLEMYLQGLSYAEMQERSGKQFKAIDNALQRIRKKLRQF